VDDQVVENSSLNKEDFGGRPPFDDPGLALVAALVGAVNIILLLVLLSVYISSYRKLKSSFSLGLVLFAVLLIMQNVLFIFFLLGREGFHGPGMGTPVLSLNIIELGALIVLVKTTWV
jgi:multisubunit Na+/H+ antiporter MnhB subunit